MNASRSTARRATRVALLAACALAALQAGTATASDTCKDVTIKMVNRTDNEIKLTKLEYYDYDTGKWHREEVFGLDGEQKIEPDFAFSPTRNLQNIGNDKTKFRLSWKRHAGGVQWNSAPAVVTADFTCTNNTTRTIEVTG